MEQGRVGKEENGKGERSGWIEMIDKKKGGEWKEKGQIRWREKDQEWKGFDGKGGNKELDCIEWKEKGGNGMTWKQY